MSSVCFTGAGDRISGEKYTRPQWQNLARQFNYGVDDKVSWSTTYLVASRTNTKKAQAARDLNVQVLTYAEFERMVLAGQTPATHRSVSQFANDAKDVVISIAFEKGMYVVTRPDTNELICRVPTLWTARGAAKVRASVLKDTYKHKVEIVEVGLPSKPPTEVVDIERFARAIQLED